MIDKRVHSLDDAIAGIGDGVTVMVSGFGGTGVPNNLIVALEATAARGLTFITNGIRFIDGIAPGFFADRRVVKVVASAARSRGKEPSLYERQITDGTFELELVPQGTFAERMRAAGAGIPAFFTPTAAGTPLGEGKETRVFDGKTCVLERALSADFTFLRADVADRWGNLRFRGAQGNFGLAMAMAAKVTVAEVTTISEEPLPAVDVHVPGIFVDRVIQLPDRR